MRSLSTKLVACLTLILLTCSVRADTWNVTGGHCVSAWSPPFSFTQNWQTGIESFGGTVAVSWQASPGTLLPAGARLSLNFEHLVEFKDSAGSITYSAIHMVRFPVEYIVPFATDHVVEYMSLATWAHAGYQELMNLDPAKPALSPYGTSKYWLRVETSVPGHFDPHFEQFWHIGWAPVQGGGPGGD